MEKQIFKDYGMALVERDGHLFIRYDAGHFATEMRESPVGQEEALRAQKSEQDAYQVLLAVQQRTGLA